MALCIYTAYIVLKTLNPVNLIHLRCNVTEFCRHFPLDVSGISHRECRNGTLLVTVDPRRGCGHEEVWKSGSSSWNYSS